MAVIDQFVENDEILNISLRSDDSAVILINSSFTLTILDESEGQ